MEKQGKGVLDCGSNKSVAGYKWMNEFLLTLTDETKNCVIEEKSNAVFRFGDGAECKSTKKLTVQFTVTIGKSEYTIPVEVVTAEIPLLIGKNTMKEIGMHLNFQTDTATVGGEKIPLSCTTSDHYCLSLNH